jgi:hypothetical protein
MSFLIWKSALYPENITCVLSTTVCTISFLFLGIFGQILPLFFSDFIAIFHLKVCIFPYMEMCPGPCHLKKRTFPYLDMRF